MSYIIEPMSLITFLDETKLKLPRFQRKSTWDKKQNFELAISIFQDYPVGVVIINQEQKVSWLLDGRQRRNALMLMRDNPVELYEWARSYIGFKKNEDIQDLTNLYWDKVEKYLETEEKDETEDNRNNMDEYEPMIYGTDEESTVYADAEENSFDSVKQRQGLKTLLDLILMVHQNKPSGSRWEQTFDFRKYFPKLEYAPVKNSGKISPKLLRRFLLELTKVIDHEYEGELTQQNLIDYYTQKFYIDESNQKKFEKDVEKNNKKYIHYVYKAKEKWYNYYIGGYKGEMKKMNFIKKAMAILLALCLSIVILSGSVNAASTTIRASASKVNNGKTVSVTVSFGENV